MALICCPECAANISHLASACPHCGHPLPPVRAAAWSAPVPRPGIAESPYAQEVTFYSDANGIRITNTRAIMQNRTYSMANISSVGVARIPPDRGLAWLLVVLGLIGMGFVFLVRMHEAPLMQQLPLAPLVSGVLLILGVLWLFLARPWYGVRISAAGGETDAILSRDRRYMDSIADALNEVIVRRG